jgi:hypothetical protein
MVLGLYVWCGTLDEAVRERGCLGSITGMEVTGGSEVASSKHALDGG